MTTAKQWLIVGQIFDDKTICQTTNCPHLKTTTSPTTNKPFSFCDILANCDKQPTDCPAFTPDPEEPSNA